MAQTYLSPCFLFSLAISSAISSLAALSLLRMPLYDVRSRFTLSVLTFMLFTRFSRALGSLAPGQQHIIAIGQRAFVMSLATLGLSQASQTIMAGCCTMRTKMTHLTLQLCSQRWLLHKQLPLIITCFAFTLLESQKCYRCIM